LRARQDGFITAAMSNHQQSQAETTAAKPETVTFAQFLESYPPSQTVEITNLFVKTEYPGGGQLWKLSTPQLQLHCTDPDCNGPRFFRYKEGDTSLDQTGTQLQAFLTYICSNCRRSSKLYSIHAVRAIFNQSNGNCYKFGELPPYGPPTPARLIRLFENERETYLRGRQCENLGLGIGAFVYYRRVVESQKNRILDEIIRVSEKIGADPGMIEILQKAKNEIQFSKALASVKDALPQALLINGHNPLTLLHRALSGGLHEQTDEECLKLAHDVRVVLVELAERLGQALKDEAELTSAVNRLNNPKPTS
jgi:hypothetical protein